ncbi:protein LIKE COV 1-like isoform X2 [Actinidia eriantha]|uniref:protein LIKE COV 1-like isoform X2 n=1 Tax=Actinidia eriantha TaxID=165200 RepID=UPI00258FC4CE|nr:protein LIKE COV 1-like isoform X2 [Actinidia eriantha]
MGDEKSSMGMGSRDRELLVPVADASPSADDVDAKPSSSASSSHHSGHETFYKVVRSWASKKFMTGCVILFPIAVTFYITWWFIHFVDGFFSPIYAQLGINVFGLGFVTSVTFIFLVGVFMSSWLGASVLGLGEWFIKRMPFVRHIYNASKQISAAISPDQNTQAFKEVAIIRHPRIGEYAFGFITSSVVLQVRRSYVVCMFPPTIFILVTYSSSTPTTLLDQTYLFGKELKLLCLGACRCRRSCRLWIQELFKSIELGLTEAE